MLFLQSKFLIDRMALFYQHNINDTTKIAVWHIAEPETFFTRKVNLQRNITHPHKRLQHLAGRYLLQFLYPDFPYDLLEIASTMKPYLPGEKYHFSVSHCGSYAAVIISPDHRVGLDIELISSKVEKIKHKFLTDIEMKQFEVSTLSELTLLWSAKESVFKWNGSGEVDFKKHIMLDSFHHNTIEGRFVKEKEVSFRVHHQQLNEITLAYVVSPVTLAIED